MVDLCGALVGWTTEKSSRKHVFQVRKPPPPPSTHPQYPHPRAVIAERSIVFPKLPVVSLSHRFCVPLRMRRGTWMQPKLPRLSAYFGRTRVVRSMFEARSQRVNAESASTPERGCAGRRHRVCRAKDFKTAGLCSHCWHMCAMHAPWKGISLAWQTPCSRCTLTMNAV